MTKPVIAVDIDEVLSPFLCGLIEWHNQHYNTALQLHDFYTYEFHKVWGGDREQAIRKGAEHFEAREPVTPLADASRVLTRLAQDFELIVVTSRPLKQKAQTESWIQQHFPNTFKEILVCNHWSLDNQGPIIKKSAACLQHEAKYLIDDFPHYIEEAVNAGLTGLLFGDYPWNQQHAQHQLIQRVANWRAVENYFYR